MAYNAERLQGKLPQIDGFAWEGSKLVDVKVTVVSVYSDSQLFVSAEQGDDAADYYGEFRSGDPWINPTLKTWAKERGFYWEWENPGMIVLCE